jgi:PAS domain S-box-containing protein
MPREHALPGIVQEALSRIGTLLDTLFETAEDAIFLMDREQFLDCNPATLRMFGCRRKHEIVGRNPTDFSPDHQPDGAASVEKSGRLIEAAIDGTPQQFEWLHCRLDRTAFEVEVQLNRCIVGGAPFLIALVRDVTARKRAEAALREEKQLNERLIDSMPGIFYVYDSDLRLRRWNRNLELLSGYTAEELRGRPIEGWFGTEALRNRAIATGRRILEDPHATDFAELELTFKDGVPVRFLCSAVHVDSPAGPMLLGVGVDVTARVRAEKALAASERSYRALFDATNDALLIYDTAGHVLDVNERACTMFGFDAAEARRLSIGDLSAGEPPYSRREALDELHHAVHEGPRVFDWRSKRRDGTSFWSEVALRAFRLDGEPRITASVRDITERKLAGLERERLMMELQAASSAKDQFLAVLSHELRNPLAAIAAGAGVLRGSSAVDDPRTSIVLDVIERNVRLQARLVNDLLDLSRLVRGKLAIQRAPVRLDDVVLSAVQTCRADAGRAGVSLETHAESEVWVHADADRIQQIVINLVDNGIKFTPRGGQVTVSVSATEQHGHLTVEDTGIGLQTERLADLFEMFQQGEVGAGRAPGLGIGLALVKSLAELQGGRVWADSARDGRGSRFTVELPRCEAPEAREAPRVSGARPTPIKLLLVEDNGDIRAMLSESLAGLGYQVVPAHSAEVALELLAREAVDAILADIGLPGMDGYEFLRQARRLPTAARAPAFALTGHGQESDVQRAHEAGYIDHFVKPVDVAELDRRIRSRLPPTAS